MPDGSNLVIGTTNTGTSTTELQVSEGTPTTAFLVGIDDGNAIVGISESGNAVSGISIQDAVGVSGGGGIGVLGVTGIDDSAGVFASAGTDSAGVWGQVVAGAGSWPGVEGFSATGNGVRGVSLAEGDAANGVVGVSQNGFGVVGLTESSSSFGGLFLGGLVVASGSKHSAIRQRDGSHRLVYCMESPESWFEDFGRATVVKGRAKVNLDPAFAAAVRTGDYHVFLCPEGDVKGLYVTRRNRIGFEVREHAGGESTADFSYRIVARRKDIQGERFAKALLPELNTKALCRKPKAIEKESRKKPVALEKLVSAARKGRNTRPSA